MLSPIRSVIVSLRRQHGKLVQVTEDIPRSCSCPKPCQQINSAGTHVNLEFVLEKQHQGSGNSSIRIDSLETALSKALASTHLASQALTLRSLRIIVNSVLGITGVFRNTAELDVGLGQTVANEHRLEVEYGQGSSGL